MKFIFNLKTFLPVLLFAFIAFSCSNDDDNNPAPVSAPTIVELAQANPDLETLVNALLAADGDLVTVLSGGEYTVLAPTNSAFDTFLAANGFASLDAVPTDLLSNILLNHVISGTVESTDLIGLGSGYSSTNATNADGDNLSIYFDTSSGVTFNGVSTVSAADVDASNGVVHVVDAVIGLPTVVDHAVANPSFSTLVTALTTLTPGTDFVDVLSGAGPFTVLAPVNDAFDALPAIPAEPELTQILLNHVIGANIASGDLSSAGSGYSNTLATEAGGENLSIYFDTTEAVSFNGMSDVVQADVVAINGFIHAVDAVITLPTIATFATSNPALSTLVDALVYADSGTPTIPYIDTVSDAMAGPFTVFAPTNDAFGNLLTDLGVSALSEIPTGTVDTVLLLHIVNGNIQSSGLPNGDITTAGGGVITADNTAFTLTNANGTSNIVVELVDIQGVNGVVHVIDRVIR